MRNTDRRKVVVGVGSGIVAFALPAPAFALGKAERHFIAEAARMKREAIAGGDQPFGAVVVKDNIIVGYGPSRVVLDRNPDAHAERVALWDAQRRLDSKDMTGAVIYSTSRPCAACQEALAHANVTRMYFGPGGTDAGTPGRSS